MAKMWGGRFKKKTDPLVEKFTASISVDNRLAEYDVLGSIAHAKMLGKCKIISKRESTKIVNGLSAILKKIKAGRFEFDMKCEDIHTNIQNALEKRIGEVAQKLHTARSRNDQVSLDLRLYCKDKLDELKMCVNKLQKSILAFAKKNKRVIIPGYTHLQRAQSMLLAHQMLAYLEMLERDKARLSSAKEGADCMPLGSMALAGTSLPVDRLYVAKLLGFSKLAENSLDAVSDRDFVIEILSVLSILAMHLSRMAEELILWSTEEFQFIDIDESLCTGSSIMPHKKNPDILELVRSRSARVYGNLISALAMMKGLPLSYNRDVQEDKRPLFDSGDIVLASLEVLERLFKNIAVNKGRLASAVEDELLCATDIAEYLVKKGLSLKKAHDATGRLVRFSLESKKKIAEIPLSRIKRFSEAFDAGVYKLLNAKKSVESKRSSGSTNPAQVSRAMQRWQRRLLIKGKP